MNTVDRIAKRHNAPAVLIFRSNTSPQAAAMQKDYIESLQRKGFTVIQIAKIMDKSTNWVYRKIKE